MIYGEEYDRIAIERLTKFLAENPYTTRYEIRKKFGYSHKFLLRLEKQGLVKGLPAAVGKSDAARMSRKKSPWGGFRLPGSPDL